MDIPVRPQLTASEARHRKEPGFFVCPAKLANPVAARQRPHPVHGEENPTRKGVSGKRWGLKEAIGGSWSVAKANLIRPIVEASVQKDAMPDS